MVMVEATSFSALLKLASNPPVDPYRPIFVQSEELTLYIAKVPGSRDVFLTPLKPRDKVVTAEDISASLYYLHVHCPEDEALYESTTDPTPLLEEVDEHNVLLNRTSQPSAPSLDTVRPPLPLRPGTKRRPLPPIPQDNKDASLYNSHEPPPPPYTMESASAPLVIKPHPPDLSLQAHKIGRKPVKTPGSSTRETAADQYDVDSGAPKITLSDGRSAREKMLNPMQTPADQNPTGGSESVHGGQDSHRGNSLGRTDQPHAKLYPTEDYPDTRTSSLNPSPMWNGSSLLNSQHSSVGLSITVIRRNPASGEQCNVATIRDIPVFEIASSWQQDTYIADPARKKGQPLYIEMTTPGYTRFIPRQAEVNRNSIQQNALAMDEPFRRRLWLEGSQFAAQGNHRKSLSAESASRQTSSLAPPQPPSHPSRYSGDFTRPSTFLTPDSPTKHSISTDPSTHRSKQKGYTFLTPWNTRCEFAAGIGHTLRCRHSLPLRQAEPVQVSELRFNLPGGGPLASSPVKENRDPASRRSRFLHHRKLSKEEVYPDGDESARMDLSLGQERAGGGFAGKRAKLGKLIVSAEGMKMLDLVVVANMGLWWRAYEKV